MNVLALSGDAVLAAVIGSLPMVLVMIGAAFVLGSKLSGMVTRKECDERQRTCPAREEVSAVFHAVQQQNLDRRGGA